MEYCHTALATERDVVDQHNTVLHHNTDQHDSTQQTHYVQVGAREEESHQHTAECKRNGEHNNERITQRLKLSGHYNKYQNDNQYSQCTQVGERILLILVRPWNLDRNTARQVHLINNSITIGYHIAQRNSGNNGRYRHNTFTILTLDSRRSRTLNYFTKVLHTDTFTGRCINKDILQIFNLCTELRSITYTDIVLITILTIIGSQSSIHAITQITGSSWQIQSM